MDYQKKSKDELINALLKLQREWNDLQSIDPCVDCGQQSVLMLHERIKELNCHKLISEILNNPEIPMDEVCEKIVQIIPDAMHYPEFAEAAVIIDQKTFKTPNYKKSRHSLFYKIEISRENRGYVEVCYPDDQLPETDSFFSPEKYELLFTIAVRLGNFIEIKEKEIALNETQGKYQHLIENITDVIFEIDVQGFIKYMSPSITRILGYTPEELTGRNFVDFVGENSAFLKKRFQKLRKKNEINNEYKVQDKHGETHWIRLSTKAIIKDGIFKGGTGTLIDITEKRQAAEKIIQQNERMSAILRALPDLIFIMDAEGTYLEYFAYNKERLLAPKDKLIGMNMRSIFDEKTANLHIQKIKECIQHKKLIIYDYSVMEDDGVLNYYEVRIILLKDDKVLRFLRNITERKNAEKEITELNQNLERIIEKRTAQLADTNETLLREIEERKLVEDDLKKARLDADRANQAKSDFLSRMSHELRTPMNSILGFAQLLDMGVLNPGQRKGVKHILHSGKLLLDLINEVLDISRIEAGRLSLSLEPIQLDPIIFEMTDLVQPSVHERQIELKLEVADDLFVKSDRQRLKQVLLNLLTNAIKYNKTGGLVTIKTDQIFNNETGEPWLRVSISDTGLGISQEELPIIFNPFERIGADNSETEGTGLGLAVVQRLVDAMGGNLGVESVKGSGSTFWFELPQCESQMKQINNDALTGVAPKNFITGKILYIEDNTTNVEFIEQMITQQRSHISLITCMNGKQALKMAKQYSPDLILLDMNLPDINGSEVLLLLLADEKTKNIPVVILSADAMPGQLEKMLKAGAKKYLTKPLDFIEFLNVIDEYVAG